MCAVVKAQTARLGRVAPLVSVLSLRQQSFSGTPRPLETGGCCFVSLQVIIWDCKDYKSGAAIYIASGSEQCLPTAAASASAPFRTPLSAPTNMLATVRLYARTMPKHWRTSYQSSKPLFTISVSHMQKTSDRTRNSVPSLLACATLSVWIHLLAVM